MLYIIGGIILVIVSFVGGFRPFLLIGGLGLIALGIHRSAKARDEAKYNEMRERNMRMTREQERQNQEMNSSATKE